MDDAVSTLVTAKTTVIPRSSRSTSRLSNILERLSDDRPLSSSGGFGKDSLSESLGRTKPASKASLIIQASRKRDTDCQTAVSIEHNLDIEFITRDEISAIQKDREELEQLLQTSVNSALKMKEKHDAILQENVELKEALDILQTENTALKEQVDELKDMMRELRRLQKEQLFEVNTHRAFRGYHASSSIDIGGQKSDTLRMSDLSFDHDELFENPDHDQEDNREQVEKLALMFQLLHDTCENAPEKTPVAEHSAVIYKSVESMQRRTKELIQFDRECRGHESKMVHDIRSLAEQAVALLVETEAAQNALKETYDTVEFAPKQTVDPYKINVKTQEREKRRRRPGSTSSGEVSSSTSGSEEQVDFLFGSPSHRYPVSPARGRSAASDDDSEHHHRLEEHPDEENSDHEDDGDSAAHHRRAASSSLHVETIAEGDEDDDNDDDNDDDDNDSLEEEELLAQEKRSRRKLRFEDEAERQEYDIEQTELDSSSTERLSERDRNVDDAEQGEEDDEEMTEEEYQYLLKLQKHQLEEAERRLKEQQQHFKN